MLGAPLGREDDDNGDGGDGGDGEENDGDASRPDIPDVFDDERRNTAMRCEACPRSCSTLLSATVSATLSRMYVWHDTMM